MFEQIRSSLLDLYMKTNWIGCSDDIRLMSGYCMMLDGNVISLRSFKQKVVLRFSIEFEYRVTNFWSWKSHADNNVTQGFRHGVQKSA